MFGLRYILEQGTSKQGFSTVQKISSRRLFATGRICNQLKEEQPQTPATPNIELSDVSLALAPSSLVSV